MNSPLTERLDRANSSHRIHSGVHDVRRDREVEWQGILRLVLPRHAAFGDPVQSGRDGKGRGGKSAGASSFDRILKNGLHLAAASNGSDRTMSSKLQACPTCKGKKKLVEEYFGKFFPKVCPTCQGKGKVPEEKKGGRK